MKAKENSLEIQSLNLIIVVGDSVFDSVVRVVKLDDPGLMISLLFPKIENKNILKSFIRLLFEGLDIMI